MGELRQHNCSPSSRTFILFEKKLQRARALSKFIAEDLYADYFQCKTEVQKKQKQMVLKGVAYLSIGLAHLYAYAHRSARFKCAAHHIIPAHPSWRSLICTLSTLSVCDL